LKIDHCVKNTVDSNGTQDKEATSYNNKFDAFRLALKFYYSKTGLTEVLIIKTSYLLPFYLSHII